MDSKSESEDEADELCNDEEYVLPSSNKGKHQPGKGEIIIQVQNCQRITIIPIQESLTSIHSKIVTVGCTPNF